MNHKDMDLKIKRLTSFKELNVSQHCALAAGMTVAVTTKTATKGSQ